MESMQREGVVVSSVSDSEDPLRKKFENLRLQNLASNPIGQERKRKMLLFECANLYKSWSETFRKVEQLLQNILDEIEKMQSAGNFRCLPLVEERVEALFEIREQLSREEILSVSSTALGVSPELNQQAVLDKYSTTRNLGDFYSILCTACSILNNSERDLVPYYELLEELRYGCRKGYQNG